MKATDATPSDKRLKAAGGASVGAKRTHDSEPPSGAASAVEDPSTDKAAEAMEMYAGLLNVVARTHEAYYSALCCASLFGKTVDSCVPVRFRERIKSAAAYIDMIHADIDAADGKKTEKIVREISRLAQLQRGGNCTCNVPRMVHAFTCCNKTCGFVGQAEASAYQRRRECLIQEHAPPYMCVIPSRDLCGVCRDAGVTLEYAKLPETSGRELICFYNAAIGRAVWVYGKAGAKK